MMMIQLVTVVTQPISILTNEKNFINGLNLLIKAVTLFQINTIEGLTKPFENGQLGTL